MAPNSLDQQLAMASTVSRAPPSGGVRFAPSPTGCFHIGNLRTAVISRMLAVQFGLPWVVRFEDIDAPRVSPGAQDQQLADLRALGLVPDIILVQSQFRARHLALFERAVASGQIYPCDCSRKEVQAQLSMLASAPHHPVSTQYSGHCRSQSPSRAFRAQHSLAWRMRMAEPSGRDDFIVARTAGDIAASFTPSYHWACAIDDLDGGYDLLVRASDLRHAIFQQRAVQCWMLSCGEAVAGFPAVFHTSLVVQGGQRLEKRSRGVTLSELVAADRTPEDILKALQRSFAGAEKFAPGCISGERAETVEFRTLFEETD